MKSDQRRHWIRCNYHGMVRVTRNHAVSTSAIMVKERYGLPFSGEGWLLIMVIMHNCSMLLLLQSSVKRSPASR